MTYQEIVNDVRNGIVSFISEKSEQHSMDPCIIMQVITETISEINYNTVIKALQDQRIISNNLTMQLQTLQAEQLSGDE